MAESTRGTKRKAAEPLPESAEVELGRIAKGFHLQDKYSDLTIVCGGREFPAHRLVVCPQSDYFARACDGGFKESTGKIEIQDTDPILYQKTLEYVYTGDYTPDLTNYVPLKLGTSSSTMAKEPKRQEDMSAFEPCFHVLMYEQGVYFQIKALRRKAREHFIRTFLSGQPTREPLVAVILQVYQSTAGMNSMKESMLVMIINEADALYKYPSRALPTSIFKELPDFAQDFAYVSLLYFAYFPGRPLMPL